MAPKRIFIFVPSLSTPACSIEQQRYRTSSPLTAAKRAYRNHKTFSKVAVLDVNTREVQIFNTSAFFRKKKSFQLRR